MDNSIPISKRLQLLRDKAHAWFKVDLSFKTVPITRSWGSRENIIAGEHFCLWGILEDTAMICPHLIAVAYVVDHKTVYIYLGALDGDGVHPQAAGEKLFLSDDSENYPQTMFGKLKGFGRHIAFSRLLDNENWASLDKVWQLQIWDWKYSTTSNSILSGIVPGPSDATVDFCVLGNNR
ncbi:hypothetical protein BDR06DRAFT_975335 [Suillus hirtellus]|nr:hypothetical protein BDR06DRAFT_975335 [Suillus hirtellus]